MSYTNVIWILLAVLGVGALGALASLIRGPHLTERVISLDLMATMAVAAVALLAMAKGQPVYLDVALVIALVAFVGSVAYARYAEAGRASRPRPETVSSRDRGQNQAQDQARIEAREEGGADA
ncbi:MAG TPA: monovalent cation/H+ antiporter complex subunit F [Fimbriimonadaceae bacterium]|nr:monovalent cation/H+ antiporter complex subunit F [Fimbriimonadaceae bacterium]HRE93580.1 monovalent cation/H+ antiporter complex subunit F [Fimbriimonadaceae bacterium]HRI73277.1 monovalent cation/H+ antiporter complex subunit F [Fimbriimonadaceae bacterium]